MAKKQVQPKETVSDKMALALAAVAEINKKLGSDAPEHAKIHMADTIPPYQRIPTGILSIDLCMGGSDTLGFGFPRGGMTQLTGADSCYKTTALHQTVARLQREGGVVAWVRAEAYVEEWAKKQGVDTHNVIMVPANPSGNEALERVVTLLESGGVDLLVIDSFQGVRTTMELDDTDIGEGAYGSGAPVMWGQAFARFARAQMGPARDTAIVWTSQVRAKIGGSRGKGGQPPEPEGTQVRSAKHWKDVDQYIRKASALYDSNEGIYGRTFATKNLKNKTAMPELTGEFDVYFKQWGEIPPGYDRAQDVLNWGLTTEVIQRGGAHYSVGGVKYNGKPAMLTALRGDESLMDDITAAVYSALTPG